MKANYKAIHKNFYGGSKKKDKVRGRRAVRRAFKVSK